MVYGLQSWLAVVVDGLPLSLRLRCPRQQSARQAKRQSTLLSPSFHPAAVSAVQLNCSCLFGRLITLHPFPHTSIVPCRGYSSSNSIFIFYAFLFSPRFLLQEHFLLLCHRSICSWFTLVFVVVNWRFSARWDIDSQPEVKSSTEAAEDK